MDLSPIVFNAITPDIDCKPHIAHALSLGLPDADDGGKTLHILANGPTALNYDFSALANWHHCPEAQVNTLAINGALGLFAKHASAPTYWMAADPQALVVDFLAEPPRSTIYFPASKCHPSVFTALEARDVRLWHVNDETIPDHPTVPAAVSVTLCALMLAMRLGYRRVHVYGWDCCFDADSKHHAGQGEPNATYDPLNIEVGEGEDAQWFVSNPTWCCEIEDAKKILPVLRWAGMDIKIHGRSLVAAILHEYAA